MVEQAQSSTVHETLPEDMLLRTWGVRNLEDTKEGEPSEKTSGRPTRLGEGEPVCILGEVGEAATFAQKGLHSGKPEIALQLPSIFWMVRFFSPLQI